MYRDASRNPVTAAQLVDAVVGSLQAGLNAGAFRPAPRYRYDTGVSLEAYQRLQAQYDELLLTAEHHIKLARLECDRKSLEIVRLRAQLAKRS